jgi:hypothetical protein
MIKSLTVSTVLALLGASVISIPGFASRAPSETVALAKADRLPFLLHVRGCSSQIWPYVEASCLHNVGSGTPVLEARLITQRR